MLLAKKDEAWVILSNEQNDFLLVDIVQMKQLEELSVNICVMARIKPSNIESDEGPSYDSSFISYGAYVHSDITICHVYYVEDLGHNLFSVGQFRDSDLEVAFRSKTCYDQNLKGGDLLTGVRESDLYTISISNMAASSAVCLMSIATSTKLWLWH
nr:integrase, catalytic region, zinc finger, CCHC-type, peptidase aspartic, catalytic [Tanacetum cinerariifolium]